MPQELDDWLTGDRRRYVAYAIVVVCMLALATAALAATFDVTVKDQGRFNTDSNLTVYHSDTMKLTSGNPFVSSTTIRLENETGAANYTGEANTDLEARIDDFNGTWSNVSQLDVSNGNLTINPDDMNSSTIKGDLDRFNFKGEAKVDDGKVDLTYGGSSGTARIEIDTNGSEGSAYGLVDTDTGEAQDVAIADSGGNVVFEDAQISDSEHRIKVKDIGTLTIREANQPHDRITGAQIEAKFFGEDGTKIINRTDDNNDGDIDLAGFPVDKEFVVVVDHPDYHQRATLIEDTAQQSTIFLLNDTSQIDNGQIDFQLQDQTGDFDAEDTSIIVERAINETRYDSSVPAEDFTYLAVAGDNIGADEIFSTQLELEERYRITVKNDDGDVRQLGSFTPVQAGTASLDIGTITAQQKLKEDVKFAANRTEINGQDSVVVEYNDTREATDTLYIKIYEWRNETNTLKQNTSFQGPLGTVSVTEQIPTAENDTEWVVEITADRSGAENIKVVRPLSPRENLLGDMPTWLVTLISISTIWIVAGAFSQLNGDIGALVVAGLGAMMYFVGFMPPDVGSGVVVLSMVTAGLIFINERRDGGL